MNANLRNFALWVIIVLLLLALFTLFQNPSQRATSQDISFSQLLSEVDQGKVRDVLIQGPDIRGTFTDGRSFQTYAPNDNTLVQRLYGKGVQITARPPGDNVPWFVSLLVSWLPFIALIGVWIFLSRQMQGGAGKAMGFGKSRAKLLTEAHGRVTFEDVAGVDEAKEDLQEIVEFLRDPQKFQRLGGGISRGGLLLGPPGTGKTLIARAVAGEANVPFFTISGSDFVEMFVGVGASRVRDMFDQAKKNAPCIIFIDEIVARGTPGFSGADLMNLVNESALLAARRGKRIVTMSEFEDAKDKVMMGAERRTLVMTDDEKRLTAYHEAGHAVVALNVPATDPVHKATIIPRGRALGMVMGRQQNVSEATAQKIDSEVRRLVEAGLVDARNILTEKRADLEALAQGLLEYETLSGDEIRNLLDGKPPVRDAGDPLPPRGSPVPSAGRNRPRPGETEGGLE